MAMNSLKRVEFAKYKLLNLRNATVSSCERIGHPTNKLLLPNIQLIHSVIYYPINIKLNSLSINSW